MRHRSLVAEVRRADERWDLFSAGESVLVGVSGGPDSMALLHALVDYGPEKSLRLHVAYLDHKLRPESTQESKFVGRVAGALDLPCTRGERDVGALADRAACGLEEAARVARYAFLGVVAAKEGATSVAVGHHSDDQAETVLMNLIRGSGLDGMKGMSPVAQYPLDGECIARYEPETTRLPDTEVWPPKLVRPLLGVDRAAVERFLTERKIDFVVDPSNLDHGMLRNRIRNQVFPLLEEINPRVRRALARNAEVVADDVDLLERLVGDEWLRCVDSKAQEDRILTSQWRDLPCALQRRLLRRVVARLGLLREFGVAHIEAVRLTVLHGESPSGLPERLTIVQGDGWFALRAEDDGAARVEVPVELVDLAIPGRIHVAGSWTFEVGLRSRRESDPSTSLGVWRAALDADSVGPNARVRGRSPGDRVQPLGMDGGHKSLQDLFVDRHIPRRERDGWPLIVAGDEVIWVPGLCVGHPFRITGATRRVLRIDAEPPTRLL